MKRGTRVVVAVAALFLLASCGDALNIATGHLKIYTIPSGAMENTLKIGDHVAADTRVHPTRGSIVVFTGPPSWQALPSGSSSSVKFVKRVIGIGGDHVVCCDQQGRITVNGVPLSEPYLYPGVKPSDQRFDVHVPAGRLWVMGDHRDSSADSRAHIMDNDGTIAESLVVGVVVKITGPKDRARPLPTPSYPGLS